MSFWNILFGIILLIIWVIAGGFITETAVKLAPYKNTDSFLNHAYLSAFWAAIITWILVVVLVILAILSVIGVITLFGSGVGEIAESGELIGEGVYRNIQPTVHQGISWFGIIFLVVALILVGITGVLAAIAAHNIAESPNFNALDNNLQKAHNSAIIAASLSLGSGGLLIIALIIYLIIEATTTPKIKTN